MKFDTSAASLKFVPTPSKMSLDCVPRHWKAVAGRERQHDVFRAERHAAPQGPPISLPRGVGRLSNGTYTLRRAPSETAASVPRPSEQLTAALLAVRVLLHERDEVTVIGLPMQLAGA
jgi:hypothetical protein